MWQKTLSLQFLTVANWRKIFHRNIFSKKKKKEEEKNNDIFNVFVNVLTTFFKCNQMSKEFWMHQEKKVKRKERKKRDQENGNCLLFKWSRRVLFSFCHPQNFPIACH